MTKEPALPEVSPFPSEDMLRERFARFLIAARRRLKFNQAEFARAIGVPRDAISRWESRSGRPDERNLRLVGSYLGVDPDELFPPTNARRPQRATLRRSHITVFAIPGETDNVVVEFRQVLPKARARALVNEISDWLDSEASVGT